VSLSPRQLLLLVLLTLAWGLNWPVMKLGVTNFPPLTFRATSMWLGLPVLYGAMRWMGADLRIARTDLPELAKLTMTNMLIWHVLAIVSLQALSSGRAAILGYTMPIFSALWGRALFGERLAARQLVGVMAAAVGVALLGAGIGALTCSLIWASLGREPGAVIVILFAIAGALAALALQRYVIVGATAFGGAWTIIVGALALTGGRAAADAASRDNVWLAYPMNPAPGNYWILLAWIALGITGAIVQLAVTAKGKQ
jgi:drug/metabolite transporter (DMT)-like permease